MIILQPNKENCLCANFAKNQSKILKKCWYARAHAISCFMNTVLLSSIKLKAIKIFKLREESFSVKIVFKFNQELRKEEGNQIRKFKSKM
jgi:hypothetical protein